MAYVFRRPFIRPPRALDRALAAFSKTNNVVVTPTTGSLTLAGYAATIEQPRSYTPTTGSLTLTGYQPTVAQSIIVTPTTGSLKTTERHSLSGFSRRPLEDRYFYQGQGGLTRNTELDLNLRTSAAGVFGRYFVQSNRNEWLGGVGLAYTRENYAGEDSLNSLELVLVTSFAIFQYDFPETDISGSLAVLPSLTESGRYRSEADLRAKYEFVDDLYFELRMYGSYDSQPPREDAEKSDYGFVTSLGYSF